MTTYGEAGVDLEGADRHVEAIANPVTATWTEDVIGNFGGFAAGVTIPAGYREPVLMMSTDGVGTKLELARRAGRWDGVGQDLVAMCVDDLAAVGARPLGFVDYLAVGALNAARDRVIVESVAAACAIAGCPLLGGETAEHPGVMEPDAVDLAGAVMGIVERGQELRPTLVAEGDVVVGLVSPNLRSNGFSLVRALFGDEIDKKPVAAVAAGEEVLAAVAAQIVAAVAAEQAIVFAPAEDHVPSGAPVDEIVARASMDAVAPRLPKGHAAVSAERASRFRHHRGYSHARVRRRQRRCRYRRKARLPQDPP